jgi:PEP-CTERM motif
MTKLASLVLSGFALTVSVAPALADSILFAKFDPTGNSPTLALKSTLVGPNAYRVDITDSQQVNFTYLIGGTPFTGATLATLVLNATSIVSGACPTVDFCQGTAPFTESGFSGGFTITLAHAQFGGSNLLSGNFNLLSSAGAQLTSTVTGTSGALKATTTSGDPNQLMFTSDFLNFGATTARDATFSLSLLSAFSVIEPSTISNFRFPSDFTAIDSGAFAETIVVVPEPSMFGLLASGLLGGLCVWQRKRRLLHR